MIKSGFVILFGLMVMLATGNVRGDVPVRIVVIGSSSAEGVGPEDINNGWVQRYREHCAAVFPGCEVINLARGGYTTFRLLPDAHPAPDGRPIPDRGRNISEAIRLAPDAIIMNLPSNDATIGVSVDEQLANYDIIVGAAERAGIPMWITSTHPRNLDENSRRNLRAVRDSTLARFGKHAIDFWSILATPDGTLKAEYDAGDAIHLNDEAHRFLFEAVRDKHIPDRVRSK